MASTDILLDPDYIDAVTDEGSFTLSISADEEPDIRLTPSQATLRLGGGGGEVSYGRIQLFTDEGAPRVFFSSGDSVPSEENAVLIKTEGSGDREAGRLSLSRVGESQPTVQLDAGSSQLTLGNLQNGSGAILLYNGAGATPHRTISINGHAATIGVGGSPVNEGTGLPGSIKVDNEEGNEMVAIEGERNREQRGGPSGGIIHLNNRAGLTNVKIDGGTGTLILGESADPAVSNLPTGEMGAIESVNSVTGELWLDDGRGRKFGLKAENGAIGLGPSSDAPGNIGIVLEPLEGVFSIVDGDGTPVFQIDTAERTVRIADGYERDAL